MADTSKFWNRVQEECRTVATRTRARAKRAVRQGVLQVDLVSLRRDRGRALADLGERVLRLWSEGGLASLEGDAEARRLKALVESIESGITAREAEAAELRQPPAELRQPPAEPAPVPPVEQEVVEPK
jgi:hypothetical protein